MSLCPCGTEKKYDDCCAPFLTGSRFPDTAEATMRSRYTAFARGDVDYILNTNHESTRHEIDAEEIRIWSNESTWLGLEIIRCDKGDVGHENGQVEFIASYEVKGLVQKHHEISEFKRENGQWFFLDGKVLKAPLRRSETKVGRNDPCLCGSGKKYKKCCA